MNKLMKILLVTVMCASLLMLFGCNNNTADPTGGETQGTQNQGTQPQAGDADTDVTQNPEGDPFDATTDADNDATASQVPPVGIEDPTDPTEAEDDFEIDFGDLTGN